MPDGHSADTVARVAALAARAAPRCGKTKVIAVDGPSGSGKTTLAEQLGAALLAPVVHMDDIYRGWDGLAESVLLVTRDVLEPLARGERAAYRRWDWHRYRLGPQVEVPATPVLVLEGAGSSVRPAGDFAAMVVWVEAEESTRRERGISRDPGFEPHWDRWAAQERRVFDQDRTRARADLVIGSG
jgi:cytidylate kinase